MIVEGDISVNSIRRPGISERTPIQRVLWSLDMGIAYRLAGFDHQTEELIASDIIPGKLVPEIRKIAMIPRSDDGAGDYPLDADQATQVAKALGITAHPESIDYFIEPFVAETDLLP